MTLNANANGIVTSTSGFLKIILLQNATMKKEKNETERKEKDKRKKEKEIERGKRRKKNWQKLERSYFARSTFRTDKLIDLNLMNILEFEI